MCTQTLPPLSLPSKKKEKKNIRIFKLVFQIKDINNRIKLIRNKRPSDREKNILLFFYKTKKNTTYFVE